jgi:DNA-binding XRE family transcriptional regulator
LNGRCHATGCAPMTESPDGELPEALFNRLFDPAESPLRVWREYRGLEVEALAEISGVSKENIISIERGDRTHDESLLRSLAFALGVDALDITPRPPPP